VASQKLPNYLRTHRKRLALSQKDIAFLLGVKSGAKVSHYERFTRLPSLKTALAFEFLFQIPVRELFEGLYQESERKIEERAMLLLEILNISSRSAAFSRKQEILKELSGDEFISPEDLL
jgi:transcriptional regulator with XRE-family HTH domain